MTLILISTTMSNGDSVPTEPSHDAVASADVIPTVSMADIIVIDDDHKGSDLFNLWHGTALIILVFITVSCCTVSVGFTCFMLWRSRLFDPMKPHDQYPAAKEGKRTAHIPLDSMSLVITMDPQLQEKKEEELSVIENVNDDEEHLEGDVVSNHR